MAEGTGNPIFDIPDEDKLPVTDNFDQFMTGKYRAFRAAPPPPPSFTTKFGNMARDLYNRTHDMATGLGNVAAVGGTLAYRASRDAALGAAAEDPPWAQAQYAGNMWKHISKSPLAIVGFDPTKINTTDTMPMLRGAAGIYDPRFDQIIVDSPADSERIGMDHNNIVLHEATHRGIGMMPGAVRREAKVSNGLPGRLNMRGYNVDEFVSRLIDSRSFEGDEVRMDFHNLSTERQLSEIPNPAAVYSDAKAAVSILERAASDILEKKYGQRFEYQPTPILSANMMATPLTIPDDGGQSFDPMSDGYDYARAKSAGMGPDGTGENAGHWGSVAPVSAEERKRWRLPAEAYVILKGQAHPTINLAIKGEQERGFKVLSLGDRLYSVPQDFKTE